MLSTSNVRYENPSVDLNKASAREASMWHTQSNPSDEFWVDQDNHEHSLEHILRRFSSYLVDIALTMGSVFLLLATGLGIVQIVTWIYALFRPIN